MLQASTQHMTTRQALALLLYLCLAPVSAALHTSLPRRVLLRNAIASAPWAIAAAPLRAAADDDVAKARAQMSASLDALDDLLKRYDDITAADGGNGIIIYLVNLGPTSPLHRIDKPSTSWLAIWTTRAPRLVDAFLGSRCGCDAYSSIFVPTGGGTTPEFWLDRSKKEIVKTRATLAKILELQ